MTGFYNIPSIYFVFEIALNLVCSLHAKSGRKSKLRRIIGTCPFFLGLSENSGLRQSKNPKEGAYGFSLLVASPRDAHYGSSCGPQIVEWPWCQ